MSSASQCAFDAPPLPRYRYHRKTGAWRKERVAVLDAANTTGGGAFSGTAAAAVAATSPHAPFESSYDFFLRAVAPPQAKRPAAERDTRKRDTTRVPIRDFEAALFKNQAVAPGGRRGRGAGEVQERRGSSLRPRKSAVETAAPTTATTAALHPLIGFASTTAIPALYAALAAHRSRPLNFAAHCTADDRLSRSEFRTFLAAVGPVRVLSGAYQDTMFRTLPSYETDTDTVAVLAVLVLLLDHRYHPRFEANVNALFRCFDVDARGAIALEVLHPAVIMAWAEVRTFGGLRDQWRRLSAVLADEMENAAARFPHLPELVPRGAVRALLSCTEALYAAMCTLDLDGGSI